MYLATWARLRDNAYRNPEVIAMSESALKNALALRESLLSLRGNLRDQIHSVDRQLNSVERFIHDWHTFSEQSGRSDENLMRTKEIHSGDSVPRYPSNKEPQVNTFQLP